MMTIFAVSDGTGDTAARVVRSALVQFPDHDVHIERRGDVRTDEQVRAVAAEAAGQPSLILHSLVSQRLRLTMLEECRRSNVDAMDMMGPLLDRLALRLQSVPKEEPGIFRQLDEFQTRAVEAVEFAFRHDDGQNPDDLKIAEVVLVGISRSTKTPLMLYLAYRGWFAANVPLVPEVPPPQTLLTLSPSRVFCLVASPGRLQESRRTRARLQGIPEEPYASLARIQHEMQYAERLSLLHRWRSVETTGRSIEEIAQEVISLLAAK